MGINFGTTTTTTSMEAVSIQEVRTSTGAITLDMSKSSVLDLTKRNPGLKNVTLAAGWDLSSNGQSFDLDICAFLLNENGKITSANDVIFFNNKEVNGIKLNGDNRTGQGDGDDETIDLDLSMISPNVKSIVFCISIFDAIAKRQTFGMVNNAYVRLLNKNEQNKEICRFCLKDDYSTSTAVIFAKLKRNNNEWEFEAVGEGKQADFNGLALLYQ